MAYEKFTGYAVNILFILISIIIAAGVLTRVYKNCFAKTKSCPATVFDKQRFFVKRFFKNDALKTEEKFTVTFLCGNKKITFYVSEISYENYIINQSGVLKYKGNKLIDFS